jgi:hypothetical protein
VYPRVRNATVAKHGAQLAAVRRARHAEDANHRVLRSQIQNTASDPIA